MFAGRFTAVEPGKHQVILSCRQTDASLETTFYVQGVATERVGRPARPEVLEEIARVTRGNVDLAAYERSALAFLEEVEREQAEVERLATAGVAA